MTSKLGNKKIKNFKKNKELDKQQFYQPQISKVGKRIIIYSLITLVIGFFLLKFTDPEGKNLASTLSPILIILSYIFIALGLIVE